MLTEVILAGKDSCTEHRKKEQKASQEKLMMDTRLKPKNGAKTTKDSDVHH